MNAPAPVETFLEETQALSCVHCGLCLGACPTYLETGNENESPRGRIYLMRALQAGRAPLGDTTVGHLDSCLGCRACEVACPSGVPYGQLLEATREHVARNHPRSFGQTLLRRFMIDQVIPFPVRLKLALVPVRLVRALKLEPWLPRSLRRLLALTPANPVAADLPAVASPPTTTATGTVGFVSGCVMSVLFGNTHRASIRLLNQAGYRVVTPAGQACCGALDAHSGNLDRARSFARRNIELFEAQDDLDAIIINAAGCGSTLKEYGQLLADDPDWADRAAAFSRKVRDLSEFLPGKLAFQNPGFQVPTTLHDACHLAHAQRITDPPRALVRAVAGDHYVALREADVCCGSAGSYNLTEPEMAARLQQRKIDNILATGAEIVVTTNPGCILQIEAGLAQAGAGHVRVMHLADYLAGAMDHGRDR